MAKGGSKMSSSGGSAKANTPSGVSYSQFMKMSLGERYDLMDRIINDTSITVPAFLDKSDTSKVIYAIGMNNKPTVVSDDQLGKMPGKDLYRTVYDTTNPPPNSADILDQIRYGDYTQMSGSGGSAHGRAIYFANSFYGSATYGNRGRNPKIMRGKWNADANVIDESTLTSRMRGDSAFMAKHGRRGADSAALYALANGIDGWKADWGDYNMIVNRGKITVSSKSKHTKTYEKTPTGRIKRRYGKPILTIAPSWAGADDAN